VQHAGGVHGRERFGDRHRKAQRLARAEGAAHAPTQVPEGEVLHDEPGMLIAHAEVVQPHHGRVGDALGDLILLQKAAKGIDRLLLILTVARDLERDECAEALALGHEQVAGRATGETADAAVPADERIAETLGLASRPAGAPDGAGMRLAPLGGGEHVRKGLPVEIRGAHRIGTDRSRLARDAGIVVRAEQHDRREAGAAGELPRPGEAAAAGPFIGQ